ncbi:MAG: HAD-IIB family hydrolase [Ruminococcus sp.]|nr:HAD-IIB family hydrolase [Ruminococcus sp.]
MKNVIFFDIDGTLITEDDKMLIPDSTRTAIARTREKGNLTFINTGRTRFNVSPQVLSLGFDGILCGCGTYIEYSGENILYHTQSRPECDRIADALRRAGVTPVYEHRDGYFFDDSAVHDPLVDHFREYFVPKGIRTDRQPEDPDFAFDKFVYWVSEQTDYDILGSEIAPYFDIIDRGGRFYECVPKGFSKATAIDVILRHTGVSTDNSYAIGDSLNDLPMLEAVPNSIAMGGAEKLYPYVSYITAPLLSDGIFKALEHFGLL